MLQGLPDPRLELPVTSSLGVGADLETAGALASCHPRAVVSYALLGRSRDRIAQAEPAGPWSAPVAPDWRGWSRRG